MSIPVRQNTYILKNLTTQPFSIGGSVPPIAVGDRATVTVDVASDLEVNILKQVALANLQQISVTLVNVAMSGYTQTILPVITEDQRVLGTLTLDGATAFTGSETTVVVSTKTISIRREQYIREQDLVKVDFMAATITPAQERSGFHTTLVTFIPVFGLVGLDTWKMTGSNIIEPGYSSNSTLQTLLARAAY